MFGFFWQYFSPTPVVFYMKGDCSLLGGAGGWARGTGETGGVRLGEIEGRCIT